MCSILGRIVSLIVLTGIAVFGQSPAFEVASIKLDPNPQHGVDGGCHGIDSHYAPNEVASAPPLGRCVITDGRLSHMLATAFSLRGMNLLKGGPDWVGMGDARYNLEAKAEDPAHTTEKQLLEMLQKLLVERFQVKYHFEQIESRGFALVVAKNGPKFHPSQGEDVTFHMTDANGNMSKPAYGRLSIVNAHGYSMGQLAEFLSGWGPGPVIDKTGLTGMYDFRLSWDEANGPSLSTAIQDLGLKLEPQKVPQALLVIDAAQKPTEN